MFLLLLILLLITFDVKYFIRYYFTCIISSIHGYFMRKDFWEESVYYDLKITEPNASEALNAGELRLAIEYAINRSTCRSDIAVCRLILTYDDMHVVYTDIAFTSDMDLLWHMNNARYLRNMYFARQVFTIENKLNKTICRIGGRMIVHWDDKAFYMEQIFERPSDNFVFAIAIVKLSLIGVTPEQVLQVLCGEVRRTRPLPEVVRWLESIQLSSERLRRNL